MIAETLARPAGAPRRPRLAAGVRLHGELVGSAFAERQWLVERDGQFLQMSELLYRVAELADGERSPSEIAAEASTGLPWRLTAHHVRWLIATKLAPAGVVEDGSVPAQAAHPAIRRATRSPLSVNLRLAAVGPRLIDPATRVLQFLYLPSALAAMLAAAVTGHVWLYFEHGVTASLRQTLHTPGLILVTLGLLLLSTAFHELGHAAALRYGGGRARGIGVGFYLIYPAFYTDVTDTYRLGRWARVRTDLGGFYFNLIFAIGMIALHAATGWEFPLLVVVLTDLEILHQLLPFVRLDGYWLLADLTGVPDFFSQMGAFVRSTLPGRLAGARRWRGPHLPRLKPWARVVFGLYTVLVIPWLAISLWLLLRAVPRVLATTWSAYRVQEEAFAVASAASDPLGVAGAAAQMLVLALPLAGTAILLTNLARTAGGALLRLPMPAVAHRALVAAVLALAVTAALGWRTASAYAGPPTMTSARCADPAGGGVAGNVVVAANGGRARGRTATPARQYVDPVDDPTAVPPRVAELVREMTRRLTAIQSERRTALSEARRRIDGVVRRFQDLASSLNDRRWQNGDGAAPGNP